MPFVAQGQNWINQPPTPPSGQWDGTCGGEHNPGGRFVRSNGKFCGARVLPGTYRCFIHGAASVASKAKAEFTLALLRMPAIEAMMSLLEKLQEPTCPTCGYPVHDSEDQKLLLQTAKAIMDRTGLHPRVGVELARQTDGDFDVTALTEDQRGRMRAHLAGLKQIKDEVRAAMTVTTSQKVM